MNSIERISIIEVRSVFQTGIVIIVIVRHHVDTIENPVMDTDIPVPDFLIKLNTAWINKYSVILPVSLHSLEPSQT